MAGGAGLSAGYGHILVILDHSTNGARTLENRTHTSNFHGSCTKVGHAFSIGQSRATVVPIKSDTSDSRIALGECPIPLLTCAKMNTQSHFIEMTAIKRTQI